MTGQTLQKNTLLQILPSPQVTSKDGMGSMYHNQPASTETPIYFHTALALLCD